MYYMIYLINTPSKFVLINTIYQNRTAQHIELQHAEWKNLESAFI